MENLGTTSAGGFAALAAHVGCRTSQWRRAVASGTASWFAMEPIWNRYGTDMEQFACFVTWIWGQLHGNTMEYCCNDVPRIVWWRFGSRHGIYSCLRLLYLPNKIIKDWNVFCRFLSPHWGFQCGIRKVTSGSEKNWKETVPNPLPTVLETCLFDFVCWTYPVP